METQGLFREARCVCSSLLVEARVSSSRRFARQRADAVWGLGDGGGTRDLSARTCPGWGLVGLAGQERDTYRMGQVIRSILPTQATGQTRVIAPVVEC